MTNGAGHRPGSLEETLSAAKDARPRFDPVRFFAEFFGLGVPTLRALGISVVRCMCGRCNGVGVQLESRMHFPLMGPPEIIERTDRPKGEPPTIEQKP